MLHKCSVHTIPAADRHQQWPWESFLVPRMLFVWCVAITFLLHLFLDFYFNRTRVEIFSHLLRQTFWFLLLSSVLFYFLQVFYFSIWDTFFPIFLHIFIQNTKKKKTENLLPHTLLTVVCQKYFLVLNNLKHDTHNCHRICLYIYGCFWNH